MLEQLMNVSALWDMMVVTAKLKSTSVFQCHAKMVQHVTTMLDVTRATVPLDSKD